MARGARWSPCCTTSTWCGANFPETLLLARDCLGWGPTAEVLTAANRLRARGMAEGWAADPEECERRAVAAAA